MAETGHRQTSPDDLQRDGTTEPVAALNPAQAPVLSGMLALGGWGPSGHGLYGSPNSAPTSAPHLAGTRRPRGASSR